jgi:hypothetical protein
MLYTWYLYYARTPAIIIKELYEANGSDPFNCQDDAISRCTVASNTTDTTLRIVKVQAPAVYADRMKLLLTCS